MRDDDLIRYYILKDRKALPVRDINAWGRWFEENGQTGRIVSQTIFRNPAHWAAKDQAEHERYNEIRRKWGMSVSNVIDLKMITKNILVSTVFLGIDHSFGAGPPLLFETMVFRGPLDDYCKRYANWEAAEAGHKAACDLVQAALLAEHVMPMTGENGK